MMMSGVARRMETADQLTRAVTVVDLARRWPDSVVGHGLYDAVHPAVEAVIDAGCILQ
jgi:hypothetical protein